MKDAPLAAHSQNRPWGTNKWVYELHAVVLGRIVTGGDHDANGLAIELSGSEGCQKPDSKNDRVEQVAIRYPVSFNCASDVGGLCGLISTNAFIRN